MSQKAHSSANREGYNHKSYEAWSRGYGTPEEATHGIAKDKVCHFASASSSGVEKSDFTIRNIPVRRRGGIK